MALWNNKKTKTKTQCSSDTFRFICKHISAVCDVWMPGRHEWTINILLFDAQIEAVHKYKNNKWISFPLFSTDVLHFLFITRPPQHTEATRGYVNKIRLPRHSTIFRHSSMHSVGAVHDFENKQKEHEIIKSRTLLLCWCGCFQLKKWGRFFFFWKTPISIKSACGVSHPLSITYIRMYCLHTLHAYEANVVLRWEWIGAGTVLFQAQNNRLSPVFWNVSTKQSAHWDWRACVRIDAFDPVLHHFQAIIMKKNLSRQHAFACTISDAPQPR